MDFLKIGEATSKILDKLEGWWTMLLTNIPNIIIALVVMIASYFASKLVYNITYKVASRYVQQASISRLISRLSSTIIVIVGLILALGALNLGETLTAILSAAGISGLVIGLALQSTLTNTVSGVVLSFRSNVRIGDWIETNGYAGEVMDVNLNYFVLREADNNHVVIPNKTILDNPFKNYTLTNNTRISLECGVHYDSDLEEVEKLTKRVLQENFNQQSREVEFFYTEFGGSSINFTARFWVHATKKLECLKAKNKAIKLVKQAFDKQNINIPFPIRTLQFDNTMKLEMNKMAAAKEKEAAG